MVKVKCICEFCKKEFIRNKSRINKTCSKACFHKLLSIGKIGKKNPRFNNGYRQYRRIMKDEKLCKNCGRKYNLETHHIDGNVRNNNPNNLVKVCRRCHMMLDGRFKNLNYNNSGVGLCAAKGGGC